MKRYTIIIALIFSMWGARGQNRQDIASFSQFQQYFNPALTGHSGSSVKNFYRDQWTSFDDAPRTLFLSGELNLSDLTKKKGSVQHAFGLSVLNDRYGALTDNRLALSYASGVRIAENMHLRAGVALTYNNTRINGDKLILNENDDPAYMSILNGDNRVNKYGVNIGVALSSENYYVGYSANDIVQHFGDENEYFQEVYVLQHVAQAGYRRALGESFGFILNGIYRYDKNSKGIAEAQLKGVVNNTFWIGLGYRNDLAYSFNAGIRFKQFKIGYSREVSTAKNDGVYRGGNEIALTYNFTPLFSGAKKVLTLW